MNLKPTFNQILAQKLTPSKLAEAGKCLQRLSTEQKIIMAVLYKKYNNTPVFRFNNKVNEGWYYVRDGELQCIAESDEKAWEYILR